MNRYEQNELFFIKKKLKYSNIGSKEFYLLVDILKKELKKHNWNDLDVDKTKTLFKHNAKGELKYGNISVKSNYFKGRQGIGFFSNNEIGIAGWADSSNIIPFLIAFENWVENL